MRSRGERRRHEKKEKRGKRLEKLMLGSEIRIKRGRKMREKTRSQITRREGLRRKIGIVIFGTVKT
eukprot:2822392-Karenia_brevis.AAC.1